MHVIAASTIRLWTGTDEGCGARAFFTRTIQSYAWGFFNRRVRRDGVLRPIARTAVHGAGRTCSRYTPPPPDHPDHQPSRRNDADSADEPVDDSRDGQVSAPKRLARPQRHDLLGVPLGYPPEKARGSHLVRGAQRAHLDSRADIVDEEDNLHSCLGDPAHEPLTLAAVGKVDCSGVNIHPVSLSPPSSRTPLPRKSTRTRFHPLRTASSANALPSPPPVPVMTANC